jgi:hypothetical protein
MPLKFLYDIIVTEITKTKIVHVTNVALPTRCMALAAVTIPVDSYNWPHGCAGSTQMIGQRVEENVKHIQYALFALSVRGTLPKIKPSILNHFKYCEAITQ